MGLLDDYNEQVAAAEAERLQRGRATASLEGHLFEWSRELQRLLEVAQAPAVGLYRQIGSPESGGRTRFLGLETKLVSSYELVSQRAWCIVGSLYRLESGETWDGDFAMALDDQGRVFSPLSTIHRNGTKIIRHTGLRSTETLRVVSHGVTTFPAWQVAPLPAVSRTYASRLAVLAAGALTTRTWTITPAQPTQNQLYVGSESALRP